MGISTGKTVRRELPLFVRSFILVLSLFCDFPLRLRVIPIFILFLLFAVFSYLFLLFAPTSLSQNSQANKICLRVWIRMWRVMFFSWLYPRRNSEAVWDLSSRNLNKLLCTDFYTLYDTFVYYVLNRLFNFWRLSVSDRPKGSIS